MNLVLMGMPGTGKGTQAENLKKILNAQVINMGNLLRIESKNNSVLGQEIKNNISTGNILPDFIVQELFKAHFDKNHKHIFEGFPRTISQALFLEEFLKEKKQKIDLVIELTASKQAVIKRILGRKTCIKCEYSVQKEKKLCGKCSYDKFCIRGDDNEQTISNRINSYTQETQRVIDLYKKQDILTRVNSEETVSNITNKIIKKIGGEPN